MTAKKPAEHDASDTSKDPGVAPAANAEPTTPPDHASDTANESEGAPPPSPDSPDPVDEATGLAVTHRYSGARVVSGVPPRDLTALDWERLTPQEIREAIQPGPDGKPLYEAI